MEYKIKIPKHILQKLERAQEIYLENKENPYAKEILETELWEILDKENVREIWSNNAEILDHFKISDELILRKKETNLYNKLLDEFGKNIEEDLEITYEETNENQEEVRLENEKDF